MRKIISILLCLSMLLSVTSVFAAEPISKVLDDTNIVNVTGYVESGDTVNILLLDDNKDVKYINEFPVNATDKTYRAKFKYEDKIEGLTLSVRQGEANVTPSVVSAISEKEPISYELNVTNTASKTKIQAEIGNYFNVADKTYTVMLAYYGENDRLLNVYVEEEKSVANDKTEDKLEYVIPQNAKKIKVFMWDSVKTMIPLAKEITGKKNDTIKVLAIGNSFAEDSTKYLKDIALTDGITMQVDTALIGGSTFKMHWDAWQNEEKAYTIYDAAWNATSVDINYFLDNNIYDFITIQQVSQDSGKYDTYSEYADKMLKYLREKQPTAEFVLHATWAYEEGSTHAGFANYGGNQKTMHDAILDAVTRYCDYAKDLTTDGEEKLPISLDGKPLRYIPTGIAFMNARQNPMFDTKYTGTENSEVDTTIVRTLHRDGYHSSYNYGRYLAALTWYACLTGNSVVNNTYTHSNPKYQIPEDARPVINRAAQDAVNSTGLWN